MNDNEKLKMQVLTDLVSALVPYSYPFASGEEIALLNQAMNLGVDLPAEVATKVKEIHEPVKVEHKPLKKELLLF